MAFETIKMKFLKKELARTEKKAAKIKAGLEKEVKQAKKEKGIKQKINFEHAKILKDEQDLRAQLKKAKTINLTPGQKKMLIAKDKKLLKRKKHLVSVAKKSGVSVAKGGVKFAKGLFKVGRFILDGDEINPQKFKKTFMSKKKR